jgi:hypothetical protein
VLRLESDVYKTSYEHREQNSNRHADVIIWCDVCAVTCIAGIKFRLSISTRDICKIIRQLHSPATKKGMEQISDLCIEFYDTSCQISIALLKISILQFLLSNKPYLSNPKDWVNDFLSSANTPLASGFCLLLGRSD